MAGLCTAPLRGKPIFEPTTVTWMLFSCPQPQTFADFKITEHREGSGFLYTFGGTPRVWDVNRFGSSRRIYFLDHGNQLFFCRRYRAPAPP
jgi:hypothetical protein